MKKTFGTITIFMGIILVGLFALGLTACESESVGCSHEWVDGDVIQEPTCTEPGSQARFCSLCGAAGEPRTLSELGHLFVGGVCTRDGCDAPDPDFDPCDEGLCKFTEWHVTTPATCGADGVETEMCEVCGKLGTRTQAITTRPAHTFNQWYLTRVATCSAYGIETEKCGVCGALGEETRYTTTRPDHNFEGGKCSVCEEPDPDYDPTCDHDAGTWHIVYEPTCTVGGTSERRCTRCQSVLERDNNRPQATGHNWNETPSATTPSTCTTAGSTTHNCTNDGCNETDVRDLSLDPDNHDMGEWRTHIAATCETAEVQRRDCIYADCDHYVTQEHGSPLDHNWGGWSTTPATCTTAGVETRSCTRQNCNEEDVRNLPLDPDNHDMGEWRTLTAATYEAAEVQRRDCTYPTCNHYVTQDYGLPLTHNWDETPSATTPSTCTTAGSTTHNCTNEGCNATYIRDLPLDPDNHVMEANWRTHIAATCVAAEVQRRDCLYPTCNHYVTQDYGLPLDHNWDETPSETIPSTCMTAGSTTHNCTNYGCDVISVRNLPLDPTNHVMGEWGTYTAATCVAAEVQHRYCTYTDCNHFDTQDYGSPLGHTAGEWHTIQQPTCGDGGTSELHCIRCPYVLETDNNRPPATGDHNFEHGVCTECSAADPDHRFTVNFWRTAEDINNPAVNSFHSVEVPDGGTIARPNDPTRIDWRFTDWDTQIVWGDTPITGNHDIVALWDELAAGEFTIMWGNMTSMPAFEVWEGRDHIPPQFDNFVAQNRIQIGITGLEGRQISTIMTGPAFILIPEEHLLTGIRDAAGFNVLGTIYNLSPEIFVFNGVRYNRYDGPNQGGGHVTLTIIFQQD